MTVETVAWLGACAVLVGIWKVLVSPHLKGSERAVGPVRPRWRAAPYRCSDDEEDEDWGRLFEGGPIDHEPADPGADVCLDPTYDYLPCNIYYGMGSNDPFNHWTSDFDWDCQGGNVSFADFSEWP